MSDAPRPDDGDDPDDDGPTRDPRTDRERPRTRAALVQRAAAAGVTAPLPPPRRTGIFVDVEDLREHVAGHLRAMTGGYEVDAFGSMASTVDGVRIFVTVGRGPTGPYVGVSTVIGIGVSLSEELMGFLLTTNHRMAFGAFSYEPDQQAVWLRHSLLGATLDGPELRSAVLTIASTANRVTELLRERVGGDAFAEQPEDVRQAVQPPEPDEDGDGISASGYL